MATVSDKMDAIESNMSVAKSIAESVEYKRSEYEQDRTALQKFKLDKFKRRLARTMYKMKQQNKPEKEMWADLKKEIRLDCKVLWQHMRTLTLKKLSCLLPANDLLENITEAARFTATDWLIFDLILVHENVDVISVKGQDTEQVDVIEPECLTELFGLVVDHEVEDLSGHELTKAWANITMLYNKGRQVSPMLLQLRWYQMKKRARTRFYDFWSAYRACRHFLPAAMAVKPTDLHIAIVTQYNSIITTAYPSWDALIEERRVILSEKFVNALGGILQSAQNMGNGKQMTDHHVETTTLETNLSQTLSELNRKVGADVTIEPALGISGNKGFISRTLRDHMNIKQSTAEAIIKQKSNTENGTAPRDAEDEMAEITRINVETFDTKDIEITKIKSNLDCNSDINIIEGNEKKDCRNVIDKETSFKCTGETIFSASGDNIRQIPININPVVSIEVLKQAAALDISINSKGSKLDRIVDTSAVDIAKIVRLNTTVPLDKTMIEFLDCTVTRVDSKGKMEKLCIIDNKKFKHEVHEPDKTINYSAYLKKFNTELTVLSEGDKIASMEHVKDIEITKIKPESCFEREVNSSVDDATVHSLHYISATDLSESVNDNNTLTQHLLYDSKLRKNNKNKINLNQETVFDTEINKINPSFSHPHNIFYDETNNVDIMDNKLTEIKLEDPYQTEILEKKLKDCDDVHLLKSEIDVSNLKEKEQETVNQQISDKNIKISNENTDVQETVTATDSNSYGNIINIVENITNKENIVHIKSKNNLSEEESTEEENFCDSFDEENLIKTSIDFEDDGIKLEEEESETTGKENILSSQATNEGESEKRKTADDNDPKIDLKLLMNTTKLILLDGFKTADYHCVDNESAADKDVGESLEPPRVKCSSWLLQKPKNCSYNPIQVCKNPDFNIRLKQKICGFLSYMKNRELLKICKPLTIDLHKAFEKKMLNGTMYLKDDFKIEKEIVINNLDSANKTLTVHSFKTNLGEIKPFTTSALLTSCQDQKDPFKIDTAVTNMNVHCKSLIARNLVATIKSDPIINIQNHKSDPIINIPNNISSIDESTFNSDIEKTRINKKGLNIKNMSRNEPKSQLLSKYLMRKRFQRRSCVAISWAAKYPKNYEGLITVDTLEKMLNLFHGTFYELQQTYNMKKKYLKDTIDIPQADIKLNNYISDQNTDPIITSKEDASKTNRNLCNMDIKEINISHTPKPTQENTNVQPIQKPYKLTNSKTFCCYASKRIATINKRSRGRIHDCAKFNACRCCCRTEYIFMKSCTGINSSKSNEISPSIDFKNNEVITNNISINEEVVKKSDVMHDMISKTQEHSSGIQVDEKPNKTAEHLVAEAKENKTSEKQLFGHLKNNYQNTSLPLSVPFQNENNIVDKSVSNRQNINSRKTIISDLMEMSGISAEDISTPPDATNNSTPNVTLPSNIIPVANAVTNTNYVTSIPHDVTPENVTIPRLNLLSVEDEEHLDGIAKVQPKLTAERSCTKSEVIVCKNKCKFLEQHINEDTPINLCIKNRLDAHIRDGTNRLAPDAMINDMPRNMHGSHEKPNNLVKPLKLFKTTYPKMSKGKDEDIIEKQKTIYTKKPIYLKNYRQYQVTKVGNCLKLHDDKKQNVDVPYDSSDEEPLAKKFKKVGKIKYDNNMHKFSDFNITADITADNHDVSEVIYDINTSLEVIRLDVEEDFATLHPVILENESSENDVCILGM